MTDGVPTQIGPYSVTREIGRGGMGVVYLARDTKLDRDVAIKALPPEVAEDSTRLERFEREAKTLAQLNHANVAGIHGVVEQDGQKYLILEYVEGETLAERLDSGPLALDEALEVSIQIAAGIEAAHEAGVIHRDLKPDNIKITPDGAAKVLDFGIARTEGATGTGTGSSISEAATLTTTPTPRSPTEPGQILGTAPYMSPEQARGRRLDKRSDVWSFGVVLYECLTGYSPFVGETVSDSIGAILHKDVELQRLPSGSSPLLRNLLRRCLQRDKNKRLRDIGDARLELMAIASGESDDGAGAATAMSSARAMIIGVAAVVLAVVVTGLGVWRYRAPEPLRVTRLSLPQVQGLEWKNGGGNNNTYNISRDGASIVYRSRRRVEGQFESVLVLRHRDQLEPRLLSDLGQFVEEPFFSPDGQWIGYIAEGEMRAVSINGDTTRRICSLHDVPGEARGIVWRDDGLVVFGSEAGGLYAVSSAGGDPRPLTTLAEDERAHSWPDVVPGTDLVLYSILKSDIAHLAWYSLDTGEHGILLESARFPHYLAPGYLIYFKRDELWADTFDPSRRQLGGNPVILDERPSINAWSGKAELALGQDGTLVYGKEFRASKGRTLAWIDRDGRETKTEFGTGPYGHVAMSPDGSKVAIETYGDGFDVWLGNIQSETKVQFNAGSGFFPIWSPDGTMIYWGAGQDLSLSRRPADGSGPAEVSKETGILRTLTPDGKHMVMMRRHPETNWDLWLVPFEGEPIPFIVEPGMQSSCAFSKDGKWVTFKSISEGRDEMFISPYPNIMDGRTRVPGEGSKSKPIFSRDGTELFFVQDDEKLMTVPLTTTPTLEIGEPKLIYDKLNAYLTTGYGYTPTPDGQRFLVIKEDPNFLAPRPELNVVVNWIEVLKAKLDR